MTPLKIRIIPQFNRMKTRKARSSKKRTRRSQKGGKQYCPTSTHEEQEIVNYWSSCCRNLVQNFDSNYRCEWHIWQVGGTCNMWVWKSGQTSKGQDQHLDVYWINWNTGLLGIKATFTEREKKNGRWREIGKYTVGTRQCDLSDYLGESQESITYGMASCINQAYYDFFERTN
jgi:hypothetical protein